MTNRLKCRHPRCTRDAQRGAYVLGQSAEGKFLVTVLCSEHGAEAERRGGRRLQYRPAVIEQLVTEPGHLGGET